MEIFTSVNWLELNTWMSLLTLTVLEIVLGIDNLVFIAIVSRRLPLSQQKLARRLGLMMALITRLLLLAGVKWMVSFTTPLVTLFETAFSGRDLLLLGGGLYLIYEGTSEIHNKVMQHTGNAGEKAQPKLSNKKNIGLLQAVFQIMMLDIIFSLDSVITAVGMAQHFLVMALAILAAVAVMVWASEILNRILRANPTIEILALSFLLLVGVVLVADGFHFHINRGYIYFAIAFSIFVESINIAAARKKSR